MNREKFTRNHKNNYVSKDLAIVIPTKDRPKEIICLLNSIVELDSKVGRIIIVASGQDICELVMKFYGELPVEYHYSEPGQIKQRNKGISYLDSSTKLVATIDDDMCFSKTAISEMIKFWNKVEPETAGVGFNITNLPNHKHTWLRGLFDLSVPEPGKVLDSGANTSITNAKESFRSEWLNGGGTVWRQKILKEFPHQEILSKWAVGEDLIYSYPIGQKLPLYVCASATIETEVVELTRESPKICLYRARTNFLWGLYFVQKNSQLSIFKFFKRKLAENIWFIFKGFSNLELQRIYMSLGILSGLILSLNCIIKKQNIIEIIEKNT